MVDYRVEDRIFRLLVPGTRVPGSGVGRHTVNEK